MSDDQILSPPGDITPATLQERVARQRATLFNMLLDPMHRAAKRCARVWEQREALDHELLAAIAEVPYCKFLYAMDAKAQQLSSTASRTGMNPAEAGRDRSHRPYMRGLDRAQEMSLSDAYISLSANRPSVTAVQTVTRKGEHIGYIGGDFDLRDLPITKDIYLEPGRWRQIKGDPAIRGQVFQQRRIQSRLDERIDDVLPVLEELVLYNGVFHIKVHFSSSRATLWLMDDPYRYQLLEFDDLVDPDVVLAFPHHEYPHDAVVPKRSIRPILDTFRHLRFADETIYLRAGSVNIFNGIVGLNFSCDGSHYIPFQQFLARDSDFWGGMD
jgi:hypothetical protein